MDTVPPGNGEERTNSALRDSKRMYEDMARVIQLGERSRPIDTLGDPSQITTPEFNEPVAPLYETDEKENMQKELQDFMNNMT